MRLFSRIAASFQTSTEQARPASAVHAPGSPIEWPAHTLPSDFQLWVQQLPHAQSLLNELGDLPDHVAGRPIEKQIQWGPSMPVRAHSLLEPERVSGPMQLSDRLHANKLPGGVVVMATPRAAQADLWRSQAASNGVTHVVRLACEGERANLDLAPPAARRPSLGRPERVADGPLGRHLDVELAPADAIAPSLLLDTFHTLAADPPASGDHVAFQSYDGDDRSAVFGAGWKVYKDLHQLRKAGRPLNDAAIEHAVAAAVLQMKTNRSAQLLSEPIHVASLLAMGQQLRDHLSHRGVKFLPEREVRFERVGDQEPLRQGPGHAAALRLAQASDWCAGLRDDPSLQELSFAPLKGSRGAPRRIRCERHLLPDARLKDLAHPRLQGAWAGPATLVLERPTPDQSLTLAVACLDHNIAAVIDLTHPSEGPAAAGPHPMANGSRTFDGDCSATFEWGRSGEQPLHEELPGATATGMFVSARVNGAAVTRDLSVDPASLRDVHPAPDIRPLELIKVPLPPAKPVPPRTLYELARIMERFRADGPGHTLAVQCPDGDTRAAAVAAADLLYSRFQQGALTEANRLDAVRDIWAGLCREYSLDLADQPEQLAHLAGMSELLIDIGKPTPRWH